VIEQIILNIINNAIYAIGQGEGKISVTCRKCTSMCHAPCDFNKASLLNSACVEVTDSGDGISEKNIEKIFKPFFTTKPLGDGTGLGLSFCKDIIESYGGEISVLSKPSEDTIFRFHLPILDSISII